MKVLSVNIGKSKSVIIGDKKVRTGIYKNPIADSVLVSCDGIVGDEQVEKSVHGGLWKAVYVYPYEHYEVWQKYFPNMKLDYGAFGENITSQGLLENEICVGDILKIGTCRFAVTEPRLPCFKFNKKLNEPKAAKFMVENLISGFYLKVIDEGKITAKNNIVIEQKGFGKIPISELNKFLLHKKMSSSHLTNILKIESVSAEIKSKILKRL